jgi:hypothetical protein
LSQHFLIVSILSSTCYRQALLLSNETFDGALFFFHVNGEQSTRGILFHLCSILCITEEFCCSSSSLRMELVSSRVLLQRDDADTKNDLSKDDNHHTDGPPLVRRSLTPALGERFSSPSDTVKNFLLHQWRGHPSFGGVVGEGIAGT